MINLGLNVFCSLKLLLALVLLSGCTNSKLVLKPLYNRLDDQIRSEFNKLGKFEDWQKEAFETRLQTFHYWHRREELPNYADLLSRVSNTIRKSGNTTQADASAWSQSVEKFVENYQSCYPAHYAIDLIKTLKPSQIDFIERRFARERFKNRRKYDSKTRDERTNARLVTIGKWANLAGFRLTRSQKNLIRNHLAETRSLHDEYYILTDQWNIDLFKTLRSNRAADFELRLKKHLESLYGLIEIHHADALDFNRRVWQRLILNFEKSLNTDQRIWLQSYLKRLGRNINTIAKVKVKFKAHSDSSQGCIPG